MFVLKKRKYTWLDMYRIPFSCAPVSTVLVTLQKAVTALVNVFQVIAVAEFLDGAIAAVVHKSYCRNLRRSEPDWITIFWRILPRRSLRTVWQTGWK